MFPPFDVPPLFEAHLEKRLQSLGHSLKQPKKVADSVRKLSNLFLKGQDVGDYWASPDFRAAYVAYFSVLNFVRARAVFAEARRRKFMTATRSLTDWGCGAGAAVWAFLAEWRESSLPKITGVDQSATALEEYKSWLKLLEIESDFKKLPLGDVKKIESDTMIFSYVLNEVESWPAIPPHVRRLIVIEPSTHQAARRLLAWRDEKIQNEKWFAWAPCTHQNPCPLLHQSGRDWCHHRVHWNKPEWFYELEKFLPMRNDTLTLSYLLLSRDKPGDELSGAARVVGDEQEEKGKTRQMICRGPNREFLSWLHRDQISLKLKRGDLVNILNAEARGGGGELRVYSAESVAKLDEQSPKSSQQSLPKPQ